MRLVHCSSPRSAGTSKLMRLITRQQKNYLKKNKGCDVDHLEMARLWVIRTDWHSRAGTPTRNRDSIMVQKYGRISSFLSRREAYGHRCDIMKRCCWGRATSLMLEARPFFLRSRTKSTSFKRNNNMSMKIILVLNLINFSKKLKLNAVLYKEY